MSVKRGMLPVVAALAAAVALQFATQEVNADLRLLNPLATDPATFVGRGGYSADGLGQNGIGGTLQVEVPPGSAVVQAYLYASYFFQPSPIPLSDLTLDLDGTVAVLSELTNAAPGPSNLRSARADVTAQVAAKVGGGGGITNFAVNTDPRTLDGVALVVIYANPTMPVTTIAVLDGGAEQAGDTVSFAFAAPLDKTVPGFSAIMSLGIGFSAQGGSGPFCGGSQFSTVDINDARLTSCAGNYDDGVPNNGALFTVGGVGDSTNNPANPLVTSGEDDELYNLEPFLSQGDTQVVVRTANPSADDIVFLSVIAITAEARVTTELCSDGLDNDGDGLVDQADPDCQSTPVVHGQMTGGGNILGTAATHGFTVWCDPAAGPNRLQINWGKNRFHLTTLTSAACEDTDGINPGQPVSNFDTITGAGVGQYNGQDGASVAFVFSDAGEPGNNDTSSVIITDAGGAVILNVSGGTKGNHQAHP